MEDTVGDNGDRGRQDGNTVEAQTAGGKVRDKWEGRRKTVGDKAGDKANTVGDIVGDKLGHKLGDKVGNKEVEIPPPAPRD